MDFSTIISNARPNIKESSLKMYVQNLKKLLGDSNDYKLLLNFEEVQEKLKDKTDNTKRNYFNSIIVFLQAVTVPPKILRKYETARDDLNERYEEIQASHELTSKDKKNFVDISVLKKMLSNMKKEITFKKLNKKELKDFTRLDKELYDGYFIFSSYLMLPLRNDLADVEIITKNDYNHLETEEKEHKNFLVLQNGVGKRYFLSLNNYKTNKVYNEKIIEIPKELMAIYKHYVTKQRHLKYLITTFNGEKVTRNYFTQFLQKISYKFIGVKISSCLLRKIVLSDKFAKLNKEKQEFSHICGHSVQTMDMVYIKNVPSKDSMVQIEKVE